MRVVHHHTTPSSAHLAMTPARHLAPAFSSINVSLCYLLLCLIYPLLSHLPSLYNFLVQRYLYSTSTVLRLRPPSPSRTQCVLKISVLSIASTIPHEFVIAGDFNIHLDNPANHFTSQFLSLLSYFNLAQHVNFPTLDKNHILDLVKTSADTLLAPAVSFTQWSPSDHFPVFTKLSINLTPFPPPTLHFFRRLHSIDIGCFLTDPKSSKLVVDPPKSLGPLLIACNTILSSLLDKHAPIVSKLSPISQYSLLLQNPKSTRSRTNICLAKYSLFNSLTKRRPHQPYKIPLVLSTVHNCCNKEKDVAA